MDIWSVCRDAVVRKTLAGELIRIVESQEQIATNALVDNLAEQALLEEMLEASKPTLPPETVRLHYLLATPFRYPPLRHGSRFGTRQEPSLFYGSLVLGAALAETAYYRLVFWSGMTVPPPSGRLTTGHTAFGARYRTSQGLSLHQEPFLDYEARITNPQDYTDSQMIGRNMRSDGIEAFEYRSARDPERGINIALFYATGFSCPTPVWQESWICETGAETVSFYSKGHGTRLYRKELFLVAGELPVPAI
jgi:hypothetical protein